MTGPHGFFVLDPVHAGDVVFAATGTGIAAVMPMLGELAPRPAGRAPARRSSSGVCASESDIFARDEIEAPGGRAPAPSWRST